MELLEVNYLFSNLIGICMAAALVIACNEIWRMWRIAQLNRANIREMGLSLSMTPPYAIFSFLVFPYWYSLYQTFSEFSLSTQPLTIGSTILAYIIVDLSYYIEHRCAHKISFFWSLYHAAHHSSNGYTIATAYRVSFFNLFFAPAFYLPAIIIGYEPILIVALQMLLFHYQAWTHTEIIGSLGWLDKIFNTPANHRMHHSSSPNHKDVNMGASLMIWDHLFGTYTKPERVPGYGIAGKSAPRRPLDIYVDGFRKPEKNDGMTG